MTKAFGTISVLDSFKWYAKKCEWFRISKVLLWCWCWVIFLTNWCWATTIMKCSGTPLLHEQQFYNQHIADALTVWFATKCVLPTHHQQIGGSFPAFRSRFAGECDRQSSDLTKFTSGYNLAVKPKTNHLRSSCLKSNLR